MRIRCLRLASATLLAALALTATAHANLLIRIDKAAQRMTVIADGEQLYVWPVSTGISQYDTPSGAYQPFRMEKDHFSREWDDAPMPYSIFFTKQGHAIHGTNHRSLGRPASHGCVRLSVAHAAILWGLVKREKMANTSVVLSGEIPDTGPPAVARGGGEYDAGLPSRRMQEAGRWREYQDGVRYYYYDERERPVRRYYYYREQQRPPPPFFWFGR